MSEPRLITPRDLIRGVAEHWKAQYYHKGIWSNTISGSSQTAYEKLAALDLETATRADVEAIIGTGGWVTRWCNGCKDYADTVVQVGDEPDYDSATAILCVPCLRKAAALVGAGSPGPGGTDR